MDHAGANRHIGTFDNREKAALLYEIVREKLKRQVNAAQPPFDIEAVEAAFKSTRKAAGKAVASQSVGSDK
jgi:selenocysteine lyase/cysteine desulfurase